MASVILLFGKDKEPVSTRLLILALVIVELLTVVVVNELEPVKVLLLARYANEEVSASWLTERPFTTAPTERLKAVTTVSVPTLPVPIVELAMVVVVKVLVPIKELLPDNVTSVEVSLKLLNDKPVIDEPVKFIAPFCTDRLVEVTLLITPLVPARLVKKPLVEVTLVPVAVVNPKAPDKVPPVSRR